MAFADQYNYRVSWSEEDHVFVGMVDEFPSLSAHGDTLAQALEEIVALVQMAIEDLEESGEVPPPVVIQTPSGGPILRRR